MIGTFGHKGRNEDKAESKAKHQRRHKAKATSTQVKKCCPLLPVDVRFALIMVETLEANCLEVYRRGRRYQVLITQMVRVMCNELLLFEVSVYRGQTISPPLHKRKSNVNAGTNMTSDTPLK